MTALVADVQPNILDPASVGTAYDPYSPDVGAKGVAWAAFAVIAAEGPRVSVELERAPNDVAARLVNLRAAVVPTPNGLPQASNSRIFPAELHSPLMFRAEKGYKV